ncbi:MAG: hypothetical protein MMC33_010836 [Icmadophila ericetorum]|nr:hypothetical protein [Icmadophila ericetorum]
MTQKRKRNSDPPPRPTSHEIDTSKPTAIFQPSKGRKYTLSLALPGSIIANAQSHELKTFLAGQIARALAVFCVDEIVLFEDGPPVAKAWNSAASNGMFNSQPLDNSPKPSDSTYLLMHILSYLETPPHLRRSLFLPHPDLAKAGILPSLDMPHHLRAHEWCQYREGVTLGAETNGTMPQTEDHHEKKKKKKKRKTSEEETSTTASPTTLVSAGLPVPVTIPASIPANTRVTLKFSSRQAPTDLQSVSQAAEAVSPSDPREEAGYYWGYSIRPAPSLSTVLTECPFEGGYDLTFGTSERGVPLTSITSALTSSIPEFNHLLLVFGGVAGLEAAVKADSELVEMGVKEPEKLFDYWVNLVEGQGSRTIRTEEAVWLGLMGLREVVRSKGVA